jgi:hypothetical protein
MSRRVRSVPSPIYHRIQAHCQKPQVLSFAIIVQHIQIPRYTPPDQRKHVYIGFRAEALPCFRKVCDLFQVLSPFIPLDSDHFQSNLGTMYKVQVHVARTATGPLKLAIP